MGRAGRVEGKVVLVTGGARGMRASHAQALVAEGAHVLIADILDDEGEAVAQKLGKSVHFVHLDVADPDQWDRAVDAVVTRFGRLDALVNNAGIVKLGCVAWLLAVRLAVELAQHNIRVNSIHPGLVHTPLSQGVTEEFMQPIPLRRGASAAEISTFVVFLVSEESGYATGAEFVVDGGLTSYVPAKI
jgi:3alpha(or 20beta)-hydroxysteroid dehydrogenase